MNEFFHVSMCDVRMLLNGDPHVSCVLMDGDWSGERERVSEWVVTEKFFFLDETTESLRRVKREAERGEEREKDIANIIALRSRYG